MAIPKYFIWDYHTIMYYTVHNIAHAAGGQLRIPHGQAVGVVLPAIMEHYPEHFINKAEELAQAMGVNTNNLSPSEMIVESRLKLLEMMKDCNFNHSFEESLCKQGLENMFWAVKFDPSSMMYPLPDEVIKNSLTSCFKIESN